MLQIRPLILNLLMTASAGQLALAAPGDLLVTAANPNPGIDDGFGRTVAVAPDGNILTGAQFDINQGVASGSAFVMNRSTGALIRHIPNPAPASDDRFGAYVWATPTSIISAAILDDAPATDCGTVYVFDAASGALQHTLNKPGAVAGENFGNSVHAVGSNILVGCWRDDSVNTDSGSVHLYSGSTGQHIRSFQHPTGATNAAFGFSVAGVGTRVLVGAPGTSFGAEAGSGTAYVFNSSTGNLLFTLQPPAPARIVSDSPVFFGFLVRGAGNDFLVGAPGADAAYLYSGTTGQLIQTFTNPDPIRSTPLMLYGVAVGASTNDIIIGSPGYGTSLSPGIAQGAAYVFNRANGLLRFRLQEPVQQQSRFGVSVAGIGNDALIGANLSTVQGQSGAGSTYIFQGGNASTSADSTWMMNGL